MTTTDAAVAGGSGSTGPRRFSAWQIGRFQHGTVQCSLCPTRFDELREAEAIFPDNKCCGNARCGKSRCTTDGRGDSSFNMYAALSHLMLLHTMTREFSSCSAHTVSVSPCV